MTKLAIGFVAATALFLGACSSTKSDSNMGATSGQCEKKSECCKEGAKGNMGAVSGEKAGCCKTKDAGNMGAVSGECSTKKSSCSKDGAMGAVSGKGECSSKAACTKAN
ncbi:MAG TPA: hypothetical protein VD971_01565 [Phycisphaerales bacterium]|nr:hypothetical protein [Phycisphaerales bacterium]